jgi:hypothetical protein
MDSLSITIIFIIISTVVGAFIKGRMRDKCLLSFQGNPVNIELKSGKTAWGVLRLESTGLELNYKEPYLDKNDNNIETSFILYKNEYPNLQCIVRYVDDLDGKSRKKRDVTLKKIHKRRGVGIVRRMRNFFGTVRDSFVEVANLLIGRAKQISPVQNVVSSQGKHVSQMQADVVSTLNTAFEPILEKHMGKKVILQLSRADKVLEYVGVLKRYTSSFLELMDMNYVRPGEEGTRKVDIVVPRSIGLIRHLGG